MVTPKRPDAACLIAERSQSPFSFLRYLLLSSPPSPLLLLAPMRFIAMANVL